MSLLIIKTVFGLRDNRFAALTKVNSMHTFCEEVFLKMTGIRVDILMTRKKLNEMRKTQSAAISLIRMRLHGYSCFITWGQTIYKV